MASPFESQEATVDRNDQPKINSSNLLSDLGASSISSIARSASERTTATGNPNFVEFSDPFKAKAQGSAETVGQKSAALNAAEGKAGDSSKANEKVPPPAEPAKKASDVKAEAPKTAEDATKSDASGKAESKPDNTAKTDSTEKNDQAAKKAERDELIKQIKPKYETEDIAKALKMANPSSPLGTWQP